MTTTELQRQVAYSGWATARTIQACRALTPEDLHKALGNSFGGILETLEHVFFADRLWLSRLKGATRPNSRDDGESYTLKELEREWKLVQRGWEEFAGGADPDAICHYRTLEGRPYSHPVGVLALHVVNHATYHRGQIATMLRQIGHKPLGTDLIDYYRETESGPSE